MISLASCAGFIVPLMLSVLVLEALPQWNKTWPGGILVLSSFLIGIAVAVVLGISLTLSEMRREGREDEAALGPADPEDRYVGVAYSAGVSLIYPDTSFDRGRLRWRDGALCFAGFGPAFVLPAHLIENVRVARLNPIITNGLPRVVVDWRHTDGALEHVVVEVRVGRTRAHLKEQTHLLADWIEAGRNRSETSSGQPAESDLPFRSSVADRAIASPRPTYRNSSALFMLAYVGCALTGYFLIISATGPKRTYDPGPAVPLVCFILCVSMFFVAWIVRTKERRNRRG